MSASDVVIFGIHQVSNSRGAVASLLDNCVGRSFIQHFPDGGTAR